MTAEPLLAAALRYAELGYSVFPCIADGKKPATKNGFHAATTDREQIQRWWQDQPMANIGIATAGLLVVDVDGQENPWLSMLSAPEQKELANAGGIARTPRGGWHYLFRRPPDKQWKCSAGKLAEHVDIRTDGGYLVVSPSVVTPGCYRWQRGLQLPLAELPLPPEWLIHALDQLSAPVQKVNEVPQQFPNGQRNATLTQLAGVMRRAGLDQAAIAAALHQTNRDRCQPPLPDSEVEQIAGSIARYSPSTPEISASWGPAEPDDSIRHDPGPIPDELLQVPGFIQEVIEYTLATAPYPEPVLAFAGALTLQAVLAGRKVRDSMDNRTNLYLLSLANSGVGKDHPRKVNSRILHEIGMAACLGTSFASGEGIEDRLYAQPTTLFQVDEIDGLLLRVAGARDARHEMIISILLQMYSSASGPYSMRAKANQERMIIDQPCLCLFGTAVPKCFYQAISQRLFTNGFVARLLVLECRGRGEGRDDVYQPIPESILETARWWASFQPGTPQQPNPIMVPMQPNAQATFAEFRQQIDRQYYQECQEASDETGMTLWARTYEKARRLALVYACSENHQNPLITHDAAVWACHLSRLQTERMLAMAQQFASESEFDNKRKLLLDTLRKWQLAHGEEWMPFWRINRNHPWTPREHEEIRNTLLEQRLIEYTVSATGGRPGALYRLGPQKAEVTK